MSTRVCAPKQRERKRAREKESERERERERKREIERERRVREREREGDSDPEAARPSPRGIATACAHTCEAVVERSRARVDERGLIPAGIERCQGMRLEAGGVERGPTARVEGAGRGRAAHAAAMLTRVRRWLRTDTCAYGDTALICSRGGAAGCRPRPRATQSSGTPVLPWSA